MSFEDAVDATVAYALRDVTALKTSNPADQLYFSGECVQHRKGAWGYVVGYEGPHVVLQEIGRSGEETFYGYFKCPESSIVARDPRRSRGPSDHRRDWTHYCCKPYCREEGTYEGTTGSLARCGLQRNHEGACGPSTKG